MSTDIKLDDKIKNIFQILQNNNFSVYLTGGFIRDFLLSKKSADYDIITNAHPNQIKKLFGFWPLELKGEKYGVIEIKFEDISCQISTFRKETDYDDFRRPSCLNFNADLKDDLLRRDFTVNAIAYNPHIGLIDMFGGLGHLKDKLLISVGNPYKKFSQDPLRILRGYRFASAFNFSLGKSETESAQFFKSYIENISGDNIRHEFDKMIVGQYFYKVLEKHYDVLSIFLYGLEETSKLYRCCANSSNVLQNIITSIQNSCEDLEVRLVLLLHDLKKDRLSFNREKSSYFTTDNGAVLQNANKVLLRLNYNKHLKNNVLKLIGVCSGNLPADLENVYKMFLKHGYNFLLKLFEIKKAMLFRDKSSFNEQLSLCNSFKEKLNFINANFLTDLTNLKIKGEDVIGLGCPAGPKINLVLNRLMYDVNFNGLQNKKPLLIKAAKRYIDV